MAEFDLRDASPVDAYRLLTPVIAPRPIAFVSSLSADGRGNLAPFSYFTMGGANPPSCVICPVNDRHGQPKDTLRNVEATREYVINVCTRAFAEAMNQTSFPYEYGDDEFDRAGLTRLPSDLVAPPRVAESPIHLECRLYTLLRHGDGPLASNYLVGEILKVHVDDDLLTDGLPDNTKIEHVARLGADWFAHVTPAALFPLGRPRGG
jgi:flavin reductase (DIM6/NTAB) family NADH-FMN oxidoreductase RutF